MIIGITGGSGCGKSTLLNIIGQLGGRTLDCDQIYHRLLETDTALLHAIGEHFPEAVENGILNRKRLGEIVFSDPEALTRLNQITHSAVKKEVLQHLADSPRLAAIDAIGLFEGGLASLCDVTVFVTAPLEDRIRRLTARDGISESYARARTDAQHEDAWFRERCDHTLHNDADPAAFRAKCLAFLGSLGIMKEKP